MPTDHRPQTLLSSRLRPEIRRPEPISTKRFDVVREIGGATNVSANCADRILLYNLSMTNEGRILEAIDDLARRTAEGFSEIQGQITAFRDAVRSDIGQLRAEIDDIRNDLSGLRTDIKSLFEENARLDDEIGDIRGFASDISLLSRRIAAIERQLGIENPVEAIEA